MAGAISCCPRRASRSGFTTLTGHGTLYNLSTNRSAALEPFVERTGGLLPAADVAHFAESGVRVQGKLHWVHSARTADLTDSTVHEKRGQEAMDAAGIVPTFTGVAIHDAGAPYWHSDGAHGLCSVHHQRKLQAVRELDGQPWAGAMGELPSTA